MHLGLIPDGNRRWCKATGASFLSLVKKNTVTVGGILMGYDRLCKTYPCLAEVRELSVYCMSIGNLCKRTSAEDGTLDMVTSTLEHMLLLLTILFVLQRHTHIELDPGDEDATTVWLNLRLLLKEDNGLLSKVPVPDPGALQACLEVMTQHGLLPPAPRLVFGEGVLERLPAEWLSALGRHQQEGACASGHVVSVLDSDDDTVPVRVRCRHGALLKSLLSFLDCAAWAPRIHVVGELHALPPRVRTVTESIATLSSFHGDGGKRLRINLAIAYDPLSDVRRQLNLASSMTPIDLVLRTSGVMRSSGFFPLQTLYSEWYYEPKLFPDLDLADVVRILNDFRGRERRFGA